MVEIRGRPVIDAPQLLEWQTDTETVTPHLNDPTANTLLDLHGVVSSCDLVLSTEGNYHPALRDVWPIFLAKFRDRPLQNCFYTTSPPIAFEQIRNGTVQAGNLQITCRPSVAVANKAATDKLRDAGYTEGPLLPLYRDRGAVILVKKGNPKHIHTVWDLGRNEVRIVTPNPAIEAGAFGNYLGTLRGIATNDAHAPGRMTADSLIDSIFNGAGDYPCKWLAGVRIHHRDLPWSVAYGRADAAIIYYHLGLFTRQSFPHLFDVVSLGGTLIDPQPLKGTVITTRFIVRIKGEWSARQLEARETLIETLLSSDFTTILEKRGLLRPDGFETTGK
jgi:Bacterial extracellular solute-binding protein